MCREDHIAWGVTTEEGLVNLSLDSQEASLGYQEVNAAISKKMLELSLTHSRSEIEYCIFLLYCLPKLAETLPDVPCDCTS